MRTVTFSVDPAIPSAFVDGVLLWNTRMTKIRFQKTSTNPDFRITPGNGGEQAAFFGLDGAQVRDDNLLALCGGLGGAMLRGRVGIVVDPFINLLGPATQRVVGAHESGHALGLNHWYAISGTGSRWYWVSVMTAYQTVDSGHNPLGPTVTDGQDVDSYYAK